jgi:hypothetical protein
MSVPSGQGKDHDVAKHTHHRASEQAYGSKPRAHPVAAPRPEPPPPPPPPPSSSPEPEPKEVQLVAGDYSLGSPDFAKPELNQTHHALAPNYSIGSPDFAKPELNIVDVALTQPTAPAPVVYVHELKANDFFIQSPIFGSEPAPIFKPAPTNPPLPEQPLASKPAPENVPPSPDDPPTSQQTRDRYKWQVTRILEVFKTLFSSDETVPTRHELSDVELCKQVQDEFTKRTWGTVSPSSVLRAAGRRQS